MVYNIVQCVLEGGCEQAFSLIIGSAALCVHRFGNAIDIVGSVEGRNTSLATKRRVLLFFV